MKNIRTRLKDIEIINSIANETKTTVKSVKQVLSSRILEEIMESPAREAVALERSNSLNIVREIAMGGRGNSFDEMIDKDINRRIQLKPRKRYLTTSQLKALARGRLILKQKRSKMKQKT